VVVGVAVASALFYAVAMVLQHHTALAAAPELSLRPGLLGYLARRPVWLAGIAANVAGFGLRFVALSGGSLVVVQPILVSSLLFALPMSARLQHDRLSRAEWTGAIAIAAGIAVFIVVAAPSRGATEASAGAWWSAGLLVAAAAAVLVGFGRTFGGRRRAACLAGAGGALLALTAALTKVTASSVRTDHLHALATWEPYALLLVGLVGALVVQSAFNAASLSASLPVLMVVELLASVVLGIALFHEHVTRGAPARVVEVVALAAMAIGVVLVAGSPTIGRTIASPPPDPHSRFGDLGPENGG
jgi:drug/metabolite transporter (DMT)-like permease